VGEGEGFVDGDVAAADSGAPLVEGMGAPDGGSGSAASSNAGSIGRRRRPPWRKLDGSLFSPMPGGVLVVLVVFGVLNVASGGGTPSEEHAARTGRMAANATDTRSANAVRFISMLAL
jgi:hypothetical protein